jgi:mRNA-degrading endonuclease RelE of RelBE toxin-antitoxin system
VYYDKLHGTLDESFGGLLLVARQTPDRVIYSEAGGPARLYRFVDVVSFTEDWADLRLGDDELRARENDIARNPARAPVVPGGGGARKTRRPDPTSGKGKRSGYRVLYAFLPTYGTVLLIAAWPKSEREDLEPDDYKAIGRIITRIQKLLDQGRIL